MYRTAVECGIRFSGVGHCPLHPVCISFLPFGQNMAINLDPQRPGPASGYVNTTDFLQVKPQSSLYAVLVDAQN